MKTFTTKEAFLLDALEYYTSDPDRRCISEPTGGCFYSPHRVNKAGISEGCLIGRHLTPQNQIIADSVEDETDIRNVLNVHPEIIPIWMQNLGTDFLSNCQTLHDNGTYWNKNGLTVAGKEFLNSIINSNSFDKSQFEKYLS